MADAVTTRYIYPPNWDGNYAATAQKIGHRRYVARYTNVCDGTGESTVAKIDVSSLLSQSGGTATKIIIEKIDYAVQGFTTVTLLFDHTADVTIMTMIDGEEDTRDWRDEGGLLDNGSGGTGDLLVTTTGNTAGDTYDITITFRVK